MGYEHTPVMLGEVIEILEPRPGKRYLDGTAGGGGHSLAILERSAPNGELLALDWDEDAIKFTQQKLTGFGERVVIRRANFTEAGRILREIGWFRVHGVLLDLGLSSHHVDTPERGFSFMGDDRLDMRMDRRSDLDARQIVNTCSVKELEAMLKRFGEEPRARRIALAIGTLRQKRPIETTRQLADVVQRAIGRRSHSVRGTGRVRQHAATKTFQALRIAVNRELDNLEEFLETGYDLLEPGGRLVVISFQSLEDRLVKRAFRKWSRPCLCPPRTPQCVCGWSRKVVPLTRRPRYPAEPEVRANPRARSAILRAVERI